MSCVIEGCKSHSSRKENEDETFTFHRFPNDDEIKKKWIQSINRSNWSPKMHSRICSKHFSKDSFVPNTNKKWRRLKPKAVPSLNIPKETSSFVVKTLSSTEANHSLAEPTTSCQYQNRMKTLSSTEANHSLAEPTTSGQYQNRMKTLSSTEANHSLAEPTTSCQYQNRMEPLTEINMENTPIQLKRKISSLDCSTSADKDEIEASSEKKIRLLEKQVENLKNVSKRRLRRINTLTKRITRLSKKNADLYTVLLDKIRLENVETKYINMLDSINKNDIIKRFLQKQYDDELTRKYSREIKKFAVTLHYLSPKAYSFVREQFENVLPHPKSISAWYKSMDCRPGFTTEALDSLKLRAKENPNKTIFCALAMDEMSIRKQVEWDGKEYFGYSNVGCDLDVDDVPVAKEALTFMVTSLNDTFKVPVGYFLIHSITAQQKAALVEQCLTLLKKCDVNVVSLTFDGAATNKAMCSHLGCDIKSESSFTHDGQEVFLWPDPCHNIKLVRNTFGDKKTFTDYQGNTVTWFYIELLNKIQNEEQLHLGTKLKNEHVHFVKQKMKVRLATQLLSESVADALEFCKQLGIPEFADCDGTVMFIRIFNNLFDIMNSRNMRARGWKRALTSFNIEETIEFFAAAEVYIKGLKLADGTQVICSNRSTGFCGFLTCMSSLIKLYNKYVVTDNNTLKYICTYKMSQDHLELFFGAIRSKCGFNNNPSARIFCAAYKKLLVHAQFKDSAAGNCIPLDKITVLNCTPNYKKAIDDSTNCRRRLEPETHDTFDDITDHDYILCPSSLSEYNKNVVEYIAGFIGKKLKKTLKCEKCIESLENTENFCEKSLIAIKNRGGLFKPTSDLNRICQVTEKVLREHQVHIGSKFLGQPRNLLEMINKVSANILPTQILCELKDHSIEQSLYDDHRNLLIKAIAQNYFKIRIHYITKQLSVPTEKIRTHLTKTIIFKGQ